MSLSPWPSLGTESCLVLHINLHLATLGGPQESRGQGTPPSAHQAAARPIHRGGGLLSIFSGCPGGLGEGWRAVSPTRMLCLPSQRGAGP